MAANAFIQCRVTSETKLALRTVAQRQQLTESAWLKRLLEFAIHGADVGGGHNEKVTRRVARHGRLYIRLRVTDQRLLRERAMARGMAPATYVSVLVRSHLSNLAPLPKDELLALKRSVAELGAIGRNLNQMAKTSNAGGRVLPGRSDLLGMLKVCEGLRDHVKALIKTNVRSWESGDANQGE